MAASGAFMGARPPMDRAHEGDPTRPPAESFGHPPDRPDETFLADLRLILIATYLKKTQPKPN